MEYISNKKSFMPVEDSTLGIQSKKESLIYAKPSNKIWQKNSRTYCHHRISQVSQVCS